LEVKYEWIKYRKKFAKTIEKIFKLLKEDEEIDESVERRLKEIQEDLSRHDTSSITPPANVSQEHTGVIERLERMYEEL